MIAIQAAKVDIGWAAISQRKIFPIPLAWNTKYLEDRAMHVNPLTFQINLKKC